MSNLDLKFPIPGPTWIKFDFHMHTLDDPLDHHVYHNVYELIDKAAALKYDALAITLHQQQFQSQSALEYAAQRGILLIPGVEQDIEGVHVLLFNFPREISEKIRTFPELVQAQIQLRESQAAETLVVAPHPFYPSGVALKAKFWENSALFDAIEVSGFYHKYWNPNKKAISTAQKLGLPLIGNSDTHTLEQFGKTWSEVYCEKTTAGILRAIKEGHAKVQGRALTWKEMVVIGWKVIALGYMKWIDYKKARQYRFVP